MSHSNPKDDRPGQATPDRDGNEIAVIGMACRFPGASDLDRFWANLRDGVESIQFFEDLDPARSSKQPPSSDGTHLVHAAAFLDDPECFDAAFFGMSHREAEITDPQHRVLLEVAWTALEHAGYHPAGLDVPAGVFAGATNNTYLLMNLAKDPQVLAELDQVQLNIGNAVDFLATRIAYKLNLKGPCYTVQSACSTSLVAVHIACENLLSESCDLALAGGVSINVGFRHGYPYLPGGMMSPDGHCRPFDAQAQGTLFGSGAGMVVLKRLEDALADGDTIHGIIRGSAVNNDGSLKVGYTAPGVDGQAQVIAEALAAAGIDAGSIGYIEAHGTATPMGDPIEVQALNKAFRASTSERGYCALGSVKSNIGHLDAAAGVAGLIKTLLALEHRCLPPSLHFHEPNPNIDFAASPFFVNNQLRDWPPRMGVRRAGISAFGVGGTNAHLVLEEAPVQRPGEAAASLQILPLSAKTDAAAAKLAAQLANRLEAQPDLDLADVAFTLQCGRGHYAFRRLVMAPSSAEAVAGLRDSAALLSGRWDHDRPPPLTFLFSGQGAQHAGMGRELYAEEPVYRAAIDRCAALLRGPLGRDLRDLLFAEGEEAEAQANAALRRTDLAQPALFITEYALVQLLGAWGIKAESFAGHSIGEYLAACLAGVFDLETALTLVTTRARLMQDLPAGSMLAVPLPHFEVETFLTGESAIAAINGPSRCVVSGPGAAMDSLAQVLAADGIATTRLHTSHAFHSPMMAPAADGLRRLLAGLTLREPNLPFLSNLSGAWITAEQATSPDYWADHLRRTVRFSDNLEALFQAEGRVLLEVGPGEMLSSLARRHPHCGPKHTVLAAMGHVRAGRNAHTVALETLGRLWLAGLEPDWRSLHPGRCTRVPLPTYPFARHKYWIGPGAAAPGVSTPGASTAGASDRGTKVPVRAGHNSAAAKPSAAKTAHPSNWLYLPAWTRTPSPPLDVPALLGNRRHWLIFDDGSPLAAQTRARLADSGATVSVVCWGGEYEENSGLITIDPGRESDYRELVGGMAARETLPDHVLHFWLAGAADGDDFESCQRLGYYSLLYLAKAVSARVPDLSCDVLIVTRATFAITATEPLSPARATIMGPCRVIPQELPGWHCALVDVAGDENGQPADMTDRLLAIAMAKPNQPLALRGGQCFRQIYQPWQAEPAAKPAFRDGGVYILTGGLVEIGIDMALYLARRYHAKLILLEDADLPPEADSGAWLEAHGEKHTISQKLNRINNLRELGGEVLAIGVDLTESAQVEAAVAAGESRFGPVQGVIHNARLLGERSFRTIVETGPAQTHRQFGPKIEGLVNLAKALDERGRNLDFFAINSSLASVLGGYGTLAYSAANSFLDTFARQRNYRRGGVWIAINWEAWLGTQVTAVSAELAAIAVTPEEGVALLEMLLSGAISEQIAVSTIALDARLEAWRERGLAIKPESNPRRHPRPDLATAFVPPGAEREMIIADVWGAALGVDRVGVHDNFFELGGDSLLAMQTVARLKQRLNMDIPVVSLYEGLTIRSLTALLDQSAREEAESMAKLADTQTERSERVSRRRSIQERQREQRRDRRSGS